MVCKKTSKNQLKDESQKVRILPTCFPKTIHIECQFYIGIYDNFKKLHRYPGLAKQTSEREFLSENPR